MEEAIQEIIQIIVGAEHCSAPTEDKMRKGQNPAKFVKDVARPERITVALLNYIPFLSGFYAETLDVLKVSLESMARARKCANILSMKRKRGGFNI